MWGYSTGSRAGWGGYHHATAGMVAMPERWWKRMAMLGLAAWQARRAPHVLLQVAGRVEVGKHTRGRRADVAAVVRLCADTCGWGQWLVEKKGCQHGSGRPMQLYALRHSHSRQAPAVQPPGNPQQQRTPPSTSPSKPPLPTPPHPTLSHPSPTCCMCFQRPSES